MLSLIYSKCLLLFGMLTLAVLITTAADNFFCTFQQKIRLDNSWESLADASHEKPCIFSEKYLKKNKVVC